MYIPKADEESDISVLHALVRAHPLATWVTVDSGEPAVNHIPMLLDPERGEFGLLAGHVARANPVWQRLSATAPSIAVFQGPESYITPSWYPSKHEHGKAVPTWNYAVVHAHGVPHSIEDRQWLLAHVSQLTAKQEANESTPWKVSDAPRDYVDRMLGAIVGIEIPITRLIGKWKVSQNKSEADRAGVVGGLDVRADDNSRQMADLVGGRIGSPR